jgi:hypothetical protein
VASAAEALPTLDVAEASNVGPAARPVPGDPTLDVTGASNVLSTPEAAAIPTLTTLTTLTTPRPGIWVCSRNPAPEGIPHAPSPLAGSFLLKQIRPPWSPFRLADPQ